MPFRVYELSKLGSRSRPTLRPCAALQKLRCIVITIAFLPVCYLLQAGMRAPLRRGAILSNLRSGEPACGLPSSIVPHAQ